jgi:hypothetical protein
MQSCNTPQATFQGRSVEIFRDEADIILYTFDVVGYLSPQKIQFSSCLSIFELAA